MPWPNTLAQARRRNVPGETTQRARRNNAMSQGMADAVAQAFGYERAQGVLNHYVGGFFVERLVRLQIQRLRYINRVFSCDVQCVGRCSGAGGSVMKGLRELLNYCIGGLFVERFVRLQIQRLRSVDGFLHAASATIEWGCGGSAGTTECVMRGGAAVVWMRGQRCKTE